MVSLPYTHLLFFLRVIHVLFSPHLALPAVGTYITKMSCLILLYILITACGYFLFYIFSCSPKFSKVMIMSYSATVLFIFLLIYS
jgi:hypothetical protein